MRDRDSYGRSVEVLALRPIFGRGLLSSEGAMWRRQRSMIQPSFQHSAMARYASVMLECIARLTSQWRDGEVRDVGADMMQYTRETICRVLFGNADAISQREMADAVSVVFGDLRAEVLYLPLWRRLPFPRSRRWNRAVKLLNRSIQQVVCDRRASAEVCDDLLADLLRARDAEGRAMSDQQLHDEILTFFLAGHETAALTLAWTAYLLARHPEIQNEVCGELGAVTAGQELKAEHYPQLRYLTAVVKEALRLYPPVWSLGRKASQTSSLGAHAVPEGTDLWLCIHPLHRDPRWYPEPERFKPERWLTKDLRRPFTYLPFGIGPRVCIGQDFAMTEAVLGLAAILKQFRFQAVSSKPVEVNPWITLRPKQRIKLRLEPASNPC